MNFWSLGLRVVGIASAAAIVLSPAVASADPPGTQDPHQPDMTKGFCPGGRFGFGKLGVCDGEKYSDGSYWHQWMTRYIVRHRLAVAPVIFLAISRHLPRPASLPLLHPDRETADELHQAGCCPFLLA